MTYSVVADLLRTYAFLNMRLIKKYLNALPPKKRYQVITKNFKLRTLVNGFHWHIHYSQMLSKVTDCLFLWQRVTKDKLSTRNGTLLMFSSKPNFVSLRFKFKETFSKLTNFILNTINITTPSLVF